MAAAAHKGGPTKEEIQMNCPDPSVHGVQPAKLQDQASKAALYVSGYGGDRASAGSAASGSINALGPDGRLSSAGAAASLKYAKAQDLPSFPTVGIDTSTSGHKAANLAAQTSKSPEWWKPELSESAGKAALIAHKDGGKVNLWQPTASETASTAAGGAMVKGIGLSPQLDYGHTELGKKNSLLAATLSVSHRNKPEPVLVPAKPVYPDAENSAFNALNAASVAHKPQETVQPEWDATEASRVVHIGHNVSREIWTDHPPIMQEIEERKRNDALRASTAVFHKQLVDAGRSSYDADDGLIAARKMANQPPRSAGEASPDITAQAKNYIHLQEAAQKLAQERLAKLDPDGITAYREHYGYTQEKKGSLRKSRRGRSGSESSSDDEDQARAGRIRSQMNKFNDQLASVDARKRDQDRAALLAAAEKSVKARMLSIDNDVFHKTGVASTAMMDGWVAEANAKATQNSEQRMANHGKVHIGGGKYMDQAELDAIAEGRLKPTLDEITDTAEKQRQRDAEIRLDEERRRAEEAEEKQRQKEIRDELKQQREDEKMQQQFEKNKEKEKKAEEVEFAKSKKRMEKEEAKQRKEAEREGKGDKRRSIFGGFSSFRSSKRSTTAAAATGGAVGATVAEEPTLTSSAVDEEGQIAVPASQQIIVAGDGDAIDKLESEVGKIDGQVAAAHDPTLDTKDEVANPEPEIEEAPITIVEPVPSPAPQIPQLDATTPLVMPDVATPVVEMPANEATSESSPAAAAASNEPAASSVAFNKGSKDSKRKSSIRGIFGKLKRSSKAEPITEGRESSTKDEGVSANLSSGPPPEVVAPQYETAAKDDATGLYSEPSIEEAKVVTIEPATATETTTEETKGGVMSKLLGKKRDSVQSPVSSVSDDGDKGAKEDEFEEARDKFEETPAQRSTEGTTERPLSKFQEDL